MSVISVRSLSYSYGRRAVIKDVSLDLDAGVSILLGRNGSGKTTLMRLLAGDLAPRRGGARGTPGNAKLRIGYLPQDPDLIGGFTALDYVRYAAWLQRCPPRTDRELARKALSAVNLSGAENTKVRSLSGGMRRRVAIAARIAPIPDLLLLDEPMNGLDPEQRRDVRDVITDIAARVPVLMSTHLVQDLPHIANYVRVLEAGQIAFSGTLSEFAAHGNGKMDAASLEDAFLNCVRRTP